MEKGKEVVSIKEARDLKSKGFDLECEFYYAYKYGYDEPILKAGGRDNYNKFDDCIYSAPTLKKAKIWTNNTKIEEKLSSKDLVSVEEAKSLKAEGFNLPCYFYYLDKDISFVNKGIRRVKLDDRRMNHNRYDDFIYSVPTNSQAEKWRKKNQK